MHMMIDLSVTEIAQRAILSCLYIWWCLNGNVNVGLFTRYRTQLRVYTCEVLVKVVELALCVNLLIFQTDQYLFDILDLSVFFLLLLLQVDSGVFCSAVVDASSDESFSIHN